jgi:hypothetical protein
VIHGAPSCVELSAEGSDERLSLPRLTRRHAAAEVEAADVARFRQHRYEATTVEPITAGGGISTRAFIDLSEQWRH